MCIYQILHKNILTFKRLDSFKEITIDFKTTLESPASLSDGFPVSIGKLYRCPCLHFIFVVARSLLFSHSTAKQPTHSNEENCSLEDSRVQTLKVVWLQKFDHT